MTDPKKLVRLHFQTSRTLDFLSRKELVAQTGHQVAEWPLVCLKELVDNALDACEEAGVAPHIQVTVDESALTITDNGPGIPASVVESVLDFNVRISSREAYVSPCRGAQGNALKTVVAMPFALCGDGAVVIESHGVRHEIRVTVDRVRQEPKIDHQVSGSPVTEGTVITVQWPDSARLNADGENGEFLQNDKSRPDSARSNSGRQNSQVLQISKAASDSARSILTQSKHRFLQIAEDYCWLNPHLHLDVDWNGERLHFAASDPGWKKWLPSNPTDPHWYGAEELERLIAANICHQDRLVRELVAEFRGLSGSAKQKRVLDAAGLSRTRDVPTGD